MMIEDKTPGTSARMRTFLLRTLAGAVVGYASAAGLMYFIEGPVGGLSISATVAALVGLIYTVIGLAVGLGTASPRIGARFLNVEDADELREQKKVLTLSGAAMTLWGIALMAVALAAPDGPVLPAVALAVGAGAMLVGTWLSVPVYRASDELMRAISLECGAVSFGLVLLVVGFWAMLAHLGYAGGPGPLDLISLFYVLMLLASFIVIGRRGMLMPR
ncbi:MAG: hypothetical protein ACKO01_13940 [Erythrobacter sp.]